PALIGGAIVALPALVAAADGQGPTPSIFAPVSTPAFAIREIAFFVLGITGAIFVVVAALTLYTIVRYRRRPGDSASEPPQVYGSLQIELAWTVVPFLIVIVLFLVTARYIGWVEPTKPGTYVGQCAEYCGLQHALMLLIVIVHPREEFDRWVAAQQAVARDDAAASRGRELFASLACISCHTVRGTPANGVFGP